MNKFTIIVFLLVTCIDVSKATFIIFENTESGADQCYFCSFCPQPFQRNDPSISITSSATGWCVLKSFSNETDSDYELEVGYEGLCLEEGCSWMIADGVLKWICCCNQHLCNTGFPIPTNTTTATPFTTAETTFTTTETNSPTNVTVSTTAASSNSSILESTTALLISILMIFIVA